MCVCGRGGGGGGGGGGGSHKYIYSSGLLPCNVAGNARYYCSAITTGCSDRNTEPSPWDPASCDVVCAGGKFPGVIRVHGALYWRVTWIKKTAASLEDVRGCVKYIYIHIYIYIYDQMSLVGFDMNRITVALHLSIAVAISAVTPQHLWHTMAWHCVYLCNGHKKWTRIKELIVATITNISETWTDSSSGNH